MGMRDKSTCWALTAVMLVSAAVWDRALATPAQSEEARAARGGDVRALVLETARATIGLGELKLNSMPNQPLDAEIELVSTTDSELAELKVGLAEDEAFVRYNIDRPAYLSEINFAVERNLDGRAVIKVTSLSPIPSRVVTLLLEVVLGRGRLLREYTVLLDP